MLRHADCPAVAASGPAPAEARQLVEESLLGRPTAVPLTQADYLDALRRVSRNGLGSGVVYDALHVCCAERIPADRILTWNLMDFERLLPEGMVVTAP